jgi:hypothetical protein
VASANLPLARDHDEKDPKTFIIERNLPGASNLKGTVLTGRATHWLRSAPGIMVEVSSNRRASYATHAPDYCPATTEHTALH